MEDTGCRPPGFGDRSQLPTMEGRDFWQPHAEPCHAQKEQPHLHHPAGNAGSLSALCVAQRLDLNMRCTNKAMRQTSLQDNAAKEENVDCAQNLFAENCVTA